jgi:hypothetical protein
MRAASHSPAVVALANAPRQTPKPKPSNAAASRQCCARPRYPTSPRRGGSSCLAAPPRADAVVRQRPNPASSNHRASFNFPPPPSPFARRSLTALRAAALSGGCARQSPTAPRHALGRRLLQLQPAAPKVPATAMLNFAAVALNPLSRVPNGGARIFRRGICVGAASVGRAERPEGARAQAVATLPQIMFGPFRPPYRSAIKIPT